METEKFDVIVIGTGPGGEGASIKAAKEGKKVAVIEKWDRVGGGCTHWGTIPSKSLRQAVQQLVEVKANPLFERTNVQITFPELLKTAENVISKQVKMRQDFYTRNGIDIIKGKARFRDEHTIEVVQPDKTISAVCAADYFVIAAGSRPFRPTDIDFNSPNIFDSDTILNLNRTPSSVTVYGAGVIGC
ncbi:MAG TPA: FAD-dependent oxidoreductase, partial [Leptospiraceae bacterium]|nr:FAD-dependent oxidoreductase [Leptospiraceae bacterium]